MKIDKKDIIHIFIIIIGIIFLAIPIFHQNLWFDESYSVAICNHSFSEIWKIGANDVHPILYYFVLHIINIIFGNNILVYRLFSWLCASIIGILGFTHIRKDFGKKVGILFSFFTFFLPVITVYAGEIRMYTFAMLLVTLMCIYAYRIYKNEGQKQIKNWILFAIFSLSSAYTHYYGLMVAGIVNLIIFIHLVKKAYKERKFIYELRIFVISAILQIILYIPWLLSLLIQMKQVSKSFWITVSFPDTIIEFFTFQFTGNLGGTYYIGNLYAIIFGLIISGYLIYLFIKNNKKTQGEDLASKLCFIIYTSVIIGACLVSIVMKRPIIYARYMLCATGIFIFFLAYNLAQKGNKYIITVICILCVIIGSYITINLCKDNYDKTNQQPFEYLKEIVKKEDIFICANELSGFVISANFFDNFLYFYDEAYWNVEEAYKAFSKQMKTIYNLDEIEEVLGRIWILDSPSYNLLETIDSKYDIEILDKKMYSTKYHGFQYTFTLVEK